MQKERLLYLIDQFLAMSATDEEKEELEAWYASFDKLAGFTPDNQSLPLFSEKTILQNPEH